MDWRETIHRSKALTSGLRINAIPLRAYWGIVLVDPFGGLTRIIFNICRSFLTRYHSHEEPAGRGRGSNVLRHESSRSGWRTIYPEHCSVYAVYGGSDCSKSRICLHRPLSVYQRYETLWHAHRPRISDKYFACARDNINAS